MKESNLKRNTLRWLKRKYPHAVVWKISDRYTSGLPDVLVVKSGQTIWIELKTDIGVTSKLQNYMINKLRSAGAEVYICRNLEEVKEIFKERR